MAHLNPLSPNIPDLATCIFMCLLIQLTEACSPEPWRAVGTYIVADGLKLRSYAHYQGQCESITIQVTNATRRSGLLRCRSVPESVTPPPSLLIYILCKPVPTIGTLPSGLLLGQALLARWNHSSGTCCVSGPHKLPKLSSYVSLLQCRSGTCLSLP
ncbi:hypothetical protein F5B21DRAFT_201096 [Xylaria acuta]|nr:hypothetical protein F5B21DRAFT_201096 [Xylaria acuta]